MDIYLVYDKSDSLSQQGKKDYFIKILLGNMKLYFFFKVRDGLKI